MEQYKGLKIFLNVFGVIFIALFSTLLFFTATNSPLMQIGGSLEWMRWRPFSPDVEIMLEAIYFVWAVFLFVSARKPTQYVSFFNFTIWANAVHGLIMIPMAITMPMYHYKLFTDIALVLILAIGLQILKPKGPEQMSSSMPMQ